MQARRLVERRADASRRVRPVALCAVEVEELRAVLDALQTSGLPYDPRIEVTPDWALVWSEMRIKISALEAGGQVELSAPAERFTPEQWRQKSEALLRQIAVRLVARRRG